MRDIPSELRARLVSGTTTLCRCWKISRRDGVVLGFTDHDADLTFDGLKFQASSGLDANALQMSNGLSVDNCQAVGALSASTIREEDIRRGRFDRAEIFHWLVDWQRSNLRVLLFRGTLGEIRRSDGTFEVELRGLAEELNMPVGRSILRSCDCVLGDARCGFDVNTSGYMATGEIAADTTDARIICVGLGAAGSNWFAHGQIDWLSGPNAGTTSIVRADRLRADGMRELDLWIAPADLPLVGDRFSVVAGCDKQASTCRRKFGNLLNFGGFPHIPGEDWVAAYPKAGEVHDGSRLR